MANLEKIVTISLSQQLSKNSFSIVPNVYLCDTWQSSKVSNKTLELGNDCISYEVSFLLICLYIYVIHRRMIYIFMTVLYCYLINNITVFKYNSSAIGTFVVIH